jgi:hypothetical protein
MFVFDKQVGRDDLDLGFIEGKDGTIVPDAEFSDAEFSDAVWCWDELSCKDAPLGCGVFVPGEAKGSCGAFKNWRRIFRINPNSPREASV